jgi:uncharacterized membrane protein
VKRVREMLAWTGLGFAIAVVWYFYSRLPERIATHFNEAGVANGFGARSTLWMLVGIAVLLYATLSASGNGREANNPIRPGLRSMSRRPSSFTLRAGQSIGGHKLFSRIPSSLMPGSLFPVAEFRWVFPRNASVLGHCCAIEVDVELE